MAELLSTEKLQPCLLDRLTDLAPQKEVESASERVISVRRYREAVFRDLQMLLSTPKADFIERAGSFPEVENSVLNYGVRNLCGRVSSSLELFEVAREIRTALEAFEPRLNGMSLSVEAVFDHWKTAGNELTFEIRAELWANPAPEELLIRTKLDLETGDFTLSEEKAA